MTTRMMTREMSDCLDTHTKNMVLKGTMHFDQKKYNLFIKRLTKVLEHIKMQGKNLIGEDNHMDSTELCRTLSLINAHHRDLHISFQDIGHIYDVNGDKTFTSVTKFVHNFAKPFNPTEVIAGMRKRGLSVEYEGMSDSDIRRKWKLNGIDASTRGTKMHYQIECFFNQLAITNNWDIDTKSWIEKDLEIELLQFTNFVNALREEADLFPYRTEWCIYHEELKFTGSVDMVFKNSSGGYDIYDWKRCKDIKKRGFNNFKNEALLHLPDCNYWHYTMQLNLYKYILESKYDVRIDNLFLVVFHPNNGAGVFNKEKCPDIQDTMKELFANSRGFS